MRLDIQGSFNIGHDISIRVCLFGGWAVVFPLFTNKDQWALAHLGTCFKLKYI